MDRVKHRGAAPTTAGLWQRETRTCESAPLATASDFRYFIPMPFVWPHVSFRRRIVRRTVGIWLGVRATLLFLSLLVREPLITPPWRVSLGIAALVAGLTLRDARRRNEFLILANFGVPKASVVTLVVVPAVLLELPIHLVPLP